MPPKGKATVSDSASERAIMPPKSHHQFSSRFGRYGTDPGAFHFPSGATFLPSGLIIVADSWNNRLQVMDLAGESPKVADVYRFQDGMEPHSIAVLGDRIFVTVQGFGATEHGLMEFSFSEADPTKEPLKGKRPGSRGGSSRGKARPRLFALCFFGSKVGTTEGFFAFPSGLAASVGLSLLFIADTGNNRVVALRPGASPGDKMSWVGSSGENLSSPSGVAVDPAGIVFLADTGNRRIAAFKWTTSFVQVEIGFDRIDVVNPKRCTHVSAPYGLWAEPLKFDPEPEPPMSEGAPSTRKPWSVLLSVADQGDDCPHALHTLVVHLSEQVGDAEEDRGQEVTTKGDVLHLSSFVGSGDQALEGPRGCLILSGSGEDDEGKQLVVIDGNNHSIVLLGWEEQEGA